MEELFLGLAADAGWAVAALPHQAVYPHSLAEACSAPPGAAWAVGVLMRAARRELAVQAALEANDAKDEEAESVAAGANAVAHEWQFPKVFAAVRRAAAPDASGPRCGVPDPRR